MLSEKQMLGSVLLAFIAGIVGAIADVKAITLIAVIWFGATMFIAQRGVREESKAQSAALRTDS